MKNLISILSLFFISFSVHSQNIINVSNNIVATETNSIYQDSLEGFISEIESQENFKYRKYLKQSKKSNKKFQLGDQVLTKTQLIKLLRKGAIKTDNIDDFQSYLLNQNKSLTNQLSKDKMHSVYHLFRKGSFENYLADMSCCIY